MLKNHVKKYQDRANLELFKKIYYYYCLKKYFEKKILTSLYLIK